MDLSARRRTTGGGLRRPCRNFIHVLTLTLLTPLTLGCQLNYYLHSAYHQSKLVEQRKPIDRLLNSGQLNPEEKRKLQLVQEAKAFGESTLGLKPTKNYTSFVRLEEPYVTYIVQAAHAYELKPYQWRFPFVGEVPYKGYFKKAYADKEAATFSSKDYDTYVRGVSAYSTLGWFQDSVLSSMLRYEDHDLVELILHETLHTTLYVKSAAEFNERLATFLGHEGMKLFYRAKEGSESPTVKKAELETADQNLFSKFITAEVEALKAWYTAHRGQMKAELKAARLEEIRQKFKTELKPKLQTKTYLDFADGKLNNAVLLAYKTYEYSLDDFAKLYAHFEYDFGKTLNWLKGLEKSPQPEKALKEFVSQTQ